MLSIAAVTPKNARTYPSLRSRRLRPAGGDVGPPSEAFSKNITGLCVSEGTRHLVTSDKPEEISWGFLPNRDAEPILTAKSGDIVAMDQIT